MIFTERKTKEYWEYETEQFVGDYYFKSKEQLPPVLLDSLVLLFTSSGSTEGSLTHKGQEIEYKFTRKDLWEDDLETNKK